jgi:hypothetical protein
VTLDEIQEWKAEAEAPTCGSRSTCHAHRKEHRIIALADRVLELEAELAQARASLDSIATSLEKLVANTTRYWSGGPK